MSGDLDLPEPSPPEPTAPADEWAQWFLTRGIGWLQPDITAHRPVNGAALRVAALVASCLIRNASLIRDTRTALAITPK